MGTDRLRVVLAMETSLLSSAIQQYLAGNPRLAVTVEPPGRDVTRPATNTVRVGLLDNPVRFALQADGREWFMAYRSLDELARVLADLDRADVVTTSQP